jgi:hypothetical protein
MKKWRSVRVPLPVFAKLVILKGLKVSCFHILLEVVILRELGVLETGRPDPLISRVMILEGSQMRLVVSTHSKGVTGMRQSKSRRTLERDVSIIDSNRP